MSKNLPLTTKIFGLLGMAAALSFTACNDNEVVVPEQQIPTTYTFENVDYSGQTQRIQMLNMLENKAKSANDGTTQVSTEELEAIFVNSEGNLFGTDKDIASKTYEESRAEIRDYFEVIGVRSGNPDNIIDGRLYDENGVEPAQMIAKGLMGALLYYQATTVYLGDDKMSVDNTEVTPGKGTAMQHHWDEAFGYFGAPTDYLTNNDAAATDDPTTKTWYWAHYANGRAQVVDVREAIFNAFIEGRAAIDRNDLEARDEAIQTIRTNWEKLIAANVVHYANSSIQDIDNNNTGNLYHHWSEAKAFLNTFIYNIDRTVSNAQLAEMNRLLGDSPAATNPEELRENLQEMNLILQEAFGFSDAEMLKL